MNLHEDILFMAFRYALGRRTYVVQDIVETLIDKWDEISLHYKKLIVKEINDAIETDNIGDEFDKAEWERILRLEV